MNADDTIQFQKHLAAVQHDAAFEQAYAPQATVLMLDAIYYLLLALIEEAAR